MKEYFFRAKRTNNGGLYFKADYGYLYTVCHRGQALNFAICKTLYGWDITHVESGFRAAVRNFRTKKEAIEYIKNPIFLDETIELVNTKSAIKIAEELKKRLEEIRNNDNI